MNETAQLVGRNEILSWYNSFLSLNYCKIEETASGAAHCQLMDAIHPGKVPLKKVLFNAAYEYEYIHNYKIFLQSIFNELGINKVIPVESLITAKCQDNLAFCQWMRRYYDKNKNSVGNSPYDPVSRRRECNCVYDGDKISAAIMHSSLSSINSSKRINAEHSQGTPSKTRVRPTSLSNNNTDKNAQEEISYLKHRLAEAVLNIDKMEKERDFYFKKLREIENLTQIWINQEQQQKLKDKENAFCEGTVRSKVAKEVQVVLYES